MPVTRFELFRYAVPLRAPLRLGGTVLPARAGLLLRLEDAAGAVGWGEAAPLPGFSQETLEEASAALSALKACFQEIPLPEAPLDPEGALAAWLDARSLPASARFAVESACWHLAAGRRGLAMPAVFASEPRKIIRLNGLLVGTTEEILAGARQLRAEGYPAAKLKVGRRPVAEDVARVRAVADALGAAIPLRLDANRAWTFAEAAAFAEAIADTAIAYIEEPLADATRLPEFAARHTLPLALDESLKTLTPDDLPERAYARALVLKPTILGGLVPALRLARRAEALGMTPVLSAAIEGGVATRALLGLATLLPDVPAGLDTYHRLADDVLAPRLAWSGGRVDVAALFGTPRTVRADLLTPLDAS